MYALFFGAGVAALAYGFMGKRVGLSNTNQVYTITGVVFVIASIIFFSILSMINNQ